MRPARTGVVILNFGAPDDTLACLKSLERSTDLDLEIVIVENGAPGPVADQLIEATMGRATVLVSGENLGYAAGNNVGFRHLLEHGCEFIWILNPDTVVEPATLARLHQHLAAFPDCGIIGPRLMLPGEPARIWFDGGLVDLTNGETRHLHSGYQQDDAPPPEVLDTGYVTGASMLVRRDVIEQIGELPEQYFLYFEEVDWCLRAQRAGWRTMVAQDTTMVHLKRSSDALPQPYFIYYLTRNRYLFAQDRLGLDGELALAHLDQTFLARWRDSITDHAPDWLPQFEELIDRAKTDARAGRTGRNDDITHFPAPSEDHANAQI